MIRAALVCPLVLALAAGCASAPPSSSAPGDAGDAAVMGDASTDAGRADGRPRCVEGVGLPYPEAPASIDVGRALPALTFATASGAVSLTEHYTPCATRPRLLLLRVLAAWSGPARHAAAHAGRILAHPQADRVTLIDLLALGPDNTPATPADLARWSARYDQPPHALAVDPAYALRALYLSAGVLPLYVFVDPRTMQVVRELTLPSREEVEYAIAGTLAEFDRIPRPRAPRTTLYDGRFTGDQMEMLREMVPAGAPPPEVTNRVADDPRAAALGRRLFLDPGLSSSGTVSCATCHDPERAFTDGRPLAVGAGMGDRNTPGVVGAAYTRWRFWDGRVDTLWAQALGPIENPREMNGSRVAAVRHVALRYAAEYAEVFGAAPDVSTLPVAGRPGDPAWEALPAESRARVDRHFTNLGKAIEAFERTLRPAMSAFDRYMLGETDALTTGQRNGLRHFFVAGCIQCHHGPMLTDDSFHNVGMPGGRLDGTPDRGRADAIATLRTLTFRSDGAFSDDPTPGEHLARLVDDPSQVGAFRTPTLRGVARTGPWGHAGTFTELRKVVELYTVGLTMPPLPGAVGARDLHLPAFHMEPGTVDELTSVLDAF